MFCHKLIELFFEFFIQALWPFTVLVIFLFLKTPISLFITNLKKLSFRDTSIETEYDEKQESLNVPKGVGNIIGFQNTHAEYLNKYSKDTLDRIEELVKLETKLKSVNDCENKLKILIDYSKLLILLKSFERNYRQIYGSQLALLEHLNSSKYETKTSLKFFYNKAVSNYPENYETYPYDNWFSFIVNLELIEVNDKEEVFITHFGKDFLKYIIDSGLTLNKDY